MTYQLKTTGIAAHCITCIAVDPDTQTIKDFASEAVTADLIIGANVTVGSQAWDGVTRHYFKPGSGTTDADFVKFGTNKPLWSFSSTDNERTVVFIGEAAGSTVRVLGADSSRYFYSIDSGAGGATYPCLYQTSRLTGGFVAPSSGQKVIFGFSLVRTTSGASFAYADLDNGTSSNVTALTAGVDASYSLSYVNRRNDSTAHQQDKTHAILIFDTALTQAEMDSLRDDWFGVLLESAGGGAVDATATGGTGTGTGSGSGGDATGVVVGDAVASGGTGTGVGSGSGGDATGTGSGTFVSSEIWSGGIRQVGVAASWTWYPGGIGADPTAALVHGSAVSDANGQLTLPGLPAGYGEMLAKTPSGQFYYEPGTVV